MKALSWMRARPKALASAAGVTVGVVAITTMAFSYEGFPTTKVDLNDGGVWITKTSSLMVGHFNHESTVLDGGLRTTGENYDILQDATNVLVVDEGSSTVTAVDPARVSLGDSAGIPGAAKVALGNKTAAILDDKSGALWVVPVRGIASFEIEATEPVAELGPNADVAVAQDGTVFALSSERGEVVTVPVDNEGEALEPTTASLGEVDASAQTTITVVGRTPVVLDAAAGAVMTPGGFRTEIPNADGAVLQQASAETDAVAVATGSELVRVPLDGSEPSITDAGGEGAPAAPVWLRGCTYGAWAGSGAFVRECAGTTNDVAAAIEEAQDVRQPRVPREPRCDHPERRRRRRRLDGERESAACRQLERSDSSRGRDRERGGLDAGDGGVDPPRAQRREHAADRGGRRLRRATGRLRPAAGDRQRQRPGRRCPGRRDAAAAALDRHRPADLQRRLSADRRRRGRHRYGHLRVRDRRRSRRQGHGIRHARGARGRRERGADAEAEDLAHGRDRRHGLVQHPSGLDRSRRR